MARLRERPSTQSTDRGSRLIASNSDTSHAGAESVAAAVETKSSVEVVWRDGYREVAEPYEHVIESCSLVSGPQPLRREAAVALLAGCQRAAAPSDRQSRLHCGIASGWALLLSMPTARLTRLPTINPNAAPPITSSGM